jgi:peptidoglycan/xylan/chitin deacetylase (PgdA/CDA1 family)
MPINLEVPIVSFTFDDFPRSSLLTGGAILRHFGAAGSYYAAFGLMGTRGASGDIFVPKDLDTLLEQGHELGCHTFAHCNSAQTRSALFEESIIQNRRALNAILPGTSFKTFSYPFSEPRLRTKQKTGRHFICCRGGNQIFNQGSVDLNDASGYFLEKSRNRPQAVKDMIDRNREARGWLIFATHDICPEPSAFGCSTEFFEEIVGYAANSGARILTVLQACEAIGAASGARFSK